MSFELGIIEADVGHTRLKPHLYSFKHKVCFLSFNIEKINSLNKFKFISLNKLNLFSFYEKDHGFKNESNLKQWIEQLLKENNLSSPEKIILLTIPRMLNYAFKPVSFWCCFNGQNELYAVLAEVNNTFKERHAYLCFSKEDSMISPEKKLTLKKVFHVSPFFDVKGNYDFSFEINEGYMNIKINHLLEDEIVLTTYMKGEITPLKDFKLLRCFFLYPLMTINVIFLIHYHALRLWFKGIKYRPKPNLPEEDVTL